jgi:hypothetical protein
LHVARSLAGPHRAEPSRGAVFQRVTSLRDTPRAYQWRGIPEIGKRLKSYRAIEIGSGVTAKKLQ